MRESYSDALKTYGAIVRLLADTNLNIMRIIDLHSHLWTPIRLGQVCILYDDTGAPRGFAAWAFLSDTSLKEFLSNAVRTVDSHEWNEGRNLWVKEFVTFPNSAMALARELKAALKQSSPGEVYWARISISRKQLNKKVTRRNENL